MLDEGIKVVRVPLIQPVVMCVSPKSIWSPSESSPNPAGQRVCVHQIHLILKSVFSHSDELEVFVPLRRQRKETFNAGLEDNSMT